MRRCASGLFQFSGSRPDCGRCSIDVRAAVITRSYTPSCLGRAISMGTGACSAASVIWSSRGGHLLRAAAGQQRGGQTDFAPRVGGQQVCRDAQADRLPRREDQRPAAQLDLELIVRGAADQ